MLPILKRKTRKLYVDILIVFVSLFIIAIASIISYMQYNQYQHSLDFSKRVVELNGTIITNDINNYLKPAQVSELLDDLFNKGSLSLQNPEYLGTFMEGILRSYPYMTSIYMIDNHGNFAQEFHITSDDEYVRKQITERPPGTEYITYFLEMGDSHQGEHKETWRYKDANGNILATRKSNIDDGYNPYLRPWYIGAQKANTRYWLNAYKFYNQNNIGLTVSYNIFNQKQQRTGVIASDFKVSELIKFLNSRKSTKNAVNFVITDNNQLLASSGNISNNFSLVDITQSPNQLINQSYQYYLKNGKTIFEFSYKDVKYLVYFRHFTYDGEDKPWVIGMLAPLQDFMAPLEKTKNVALSFSIIILLVGIAIIVIVSRNISQPIVRLAKEMEDIKNLKLDNAINLNTNIEETRIMLDALKAMRASIKSFSAYVPKDLVAELINQGEIAKLGFKKRQLTILFADITGFSAISEKISLEDLTHLLSEYLQALTEIIKAHRGTVDKYTGDGLMAFWGAPSDDPEQARNACKSAVLCQRKIRQMNIQWQSQGKPAFLTRIGIDMGITLVGNLGSTERMNYTAIGETVNLAAYLENLNKQYHTEIIVSDAIYHHCKDEFPFLPLGSITAKGSQQHVNLYELLVSENLSEDDMEESPSVSSHLLQNPIILPSANE